MLKSTTQTIAYETIPAMASRLRPDNAADPDESAMDILAQLEQLKVTAERAGDMALAARVKAMFDDYLTRYCDGKRAGLEETLRHHFRPPKDYLN